MAFATLAPSQVATDPSKPGRIPRVGRPRSFALLNRLIRDVVGTTFQQVAEYLDREHQNEYPAALSKNLRKCERLVENFLSSPPTKQGFLNLHEASRNRYSAMPIIFRADRGVGDDGRRSFHGSKRSRVSRKRRSNTIVGPAYL